ncbi:hypothetical protein C8J56DRAFT_1031807 [Mycena floridula]|nr:hypothetical protein C8J56DRAFT_1031807 [Mycena floridula]
MPARNNKRENWDNSRNNEWEPDKDDGSCDKSGAVRVIQNADHDQSWETKQAYPFDKVIDVGSAEGDVSRHLVRVRNQMLSQRGLTKAPSARYSAFGDAEEMKTGNKALGTSFLLKLNSRQRSAGPERPQYSPYRPMKHEYPSSSTGRQIPVSLLVTSDLLLPITIPILINPGPMIAKDSERMTEVTIPPCIDMIEALLIINTPAHLDEDQSNQNSQSRSPRPSTRFPQVFVLESA